MKLSEIVTEAKKVASRDHVSFPYAARVALSNKGFPSHIHKSQTLRVSHIVNDLELPENLDLFRAITTALGREGGQCAAVTRKQLDLQLT